MSTSTKRGAEAEGLALAYLENQGLLLLERNFHCRHGEIDLVMKHKESLVFVEVRYRRDSYFGSGAASVDYRKQKKLAATAAYFLHGQGTLTPPPCRFDVVSVSGLLGSAEIDWITNAFEV